MKKQLREVRPNPEAMLDEDIIRHMLQPDTTKETFFLLYARLVELRLRPTNLIYEEPGLLRLTKGGESIYTLYLENLWISCCANRKAGRENIESYLRVAEDLGRDTPITRHSIIPWVKDQEYVDQFMKDSGLARQHLAADLWIVYASQGEGSSSSVTNLELSKLGIATGELLPLAITNLKRILPPIEVKDFGTWSLMWAGADYVPSLLLFDDLWDTIASKTKGDLIAAVPVSDSLFFTSASSPAGISHIRKRALALEAEGDHVVSSTLLRRVPGGWKAFD
jgi:hypothetical protein